MTLPQLAKKHNIDPESAKAFLREWLDAQDVYGYVDGKNDMWYSRKMAGLEALPLIARPTDLGE